MPKVSVIIPVYNVEKYIEKCARSLFEQTLDDIEYIFIDDCSPDNSMLVLSKVLKSYPKREAQVRIIRNPENKGVAYSRTIGMKAATGEYMIHCDPDDWVDKELYQNMYEEAHKNNKEYDKGIDLVVCQIKIHESNKEYNCPLVYESTPNKTLQKLYKKHHRTFSLCDKLIKRSIIVNYVLYPYPNINFGEDQNVVVRILALASNLSIINDVFYHYSKDNVKSATNKKKFYKDWECWKKNVELIYEFLINKNSKKYKKTALYFKLDAKLTFLDLIDNRKYWFNLYRDSHPYILFFNEYPLLTRIKYFIILSNFTFFKMSKLYR